MQMGNKTVSGTNRPGRTHADECGRNGDKRVNREIRETRERKTVEPGFVRRRSRLFASFAYFAVPQDLSLARWRLTRRPQQTTIDHGLPGALPFREDNAVCRLRKRTTAGYVRG